MNNKALWAVIVVLAAAAVGEGVYIYKLKKDQSTAAAPSLALDQDKWIEEARKSLSKGAPIPFQRFDELFDDDFFGRRFDPFGEIDSFHKKLNPLLSDKERSVFRRSWNDWIRERMEIGEIRPEVKTTDKEVVLTLKVPGREGEAFNVDVNGDRIRVAYDAAVVQDKKDEKTGATVKSEAVQHVEKVIPIPEGADPEKHRIVREGDKVKIIFEKRANQKA